MGAPPVPADFKVKLRNGFDGLFILSGGFNRATAETALVEKRGDLVAFGRPLLANPDLVARMQANAPLNEPDPSTFYTPGAKGYTDYRTLSSREAVSRA
jgi:N-ethylmaleimide reductase